MSRGRCVFESGATGRKLAIDIVESEGRVSFKKGDWESVVGMMEECGLFWRVLRKE